MHRFSPSVNIIRDQRRELPYTVTPNAAHVLNQLLNSFRAGHRAFNIIGAYGSGKSAFLSAFERQLSGQTKLFRVPTTIFPAYEIIRIVGTYSSITEAVGKALGCGKNKASDSRSVILQLHQQLFAKSKQKKGIAFVIDEFGKFLEHASANSPEKELYFIQELSETVSDPAVNGLLVTSQHQDFSSYSFGLSPAQRNEWLKIQGRFKEIPFNESVEHLLHVAADKLPQRNPPRHFSALLKSIRQSHSNLAKEFDDAFALKLLPFDFLSVSLLTIALQRYGQNERSLFSFLEGDDYLGIHDLDDVDLNYNLVNVYDYLNHNYFSFLYSKHNPDYTHWASIRSALERVDALLDSDREVGRSIIKIVGLCNALCPASSSIDKDFLLSYMKLSIGTKDAPALLGKLETSKIIRYTKFNRRYVLFEGTDVDIEIAIDEAGRLVEQVTDIVSHLTKYLSLPIVPAKAVSYMTGTSRFFLFRLSDSPISYEARDETDGCINLLFPANHDVSIEACKAITDRNPVLYGVYHNTSAIRVLLFEIEKAKRARISNSEDVVAARELDAIIDHQVRLLNHYVQGSFYASDIVTWYWQGKQVTLRSSADLNKLLSLICGVVYDKAPTFSSELINRSKLSSAVRTARRKFLQALTERWSETDLGFEEMRFPPEKTIYLSLLKTTGIHRTKNGVLGLYPPNDKSFQPLWKLGVDFFRNARSKRTSLRDLHDSYSHPPFKLKSGFLDFWLPIVLFMHRDEFALFHKGTFVPSLTYETLELLTKSPEEYEIKVFNVDGVRLEMFQHYRRFLNQSQASEVSSAILIETIRPFLTFYRALPNYAKTTSRLSSKAIAIREVIASSTDPERTFFDEFPAALSYDLPSLTRNQSTLREYINGLQGAIREIRTAFDGLLDRFESFLCNDILGYNAEFPEYQKTLQARYNGVKLYLLSTEDKVLYQRLYSPLDDRRAWLSSLAQCIVNRRVEDFRDNEEAMLYERLNQTFKRFDDYAELSSLAIEDNIEEAMKVSIVSTNSADKNLIVRLPKPSVQVDALAGRLSTLLSKSPEVNKGALLKLLIKELDGKN